MPAVPSSLFEPLWDQFSALLPNRPEFDPSHPLGCHKSRIPDETVFCVVVQALVHGSWSMTVRRVRTRQHTVEQVDGQDRMSYRLLHTPCRRRLAARYLFRDRDSIFTDGFEAVFAAENIEVKKSAPQSPKMNASAKGWVKTTG